MTISHYDTAVFYMFFSMMNLLCGYVILFVLIPKVSFTTTIAIFFICFECIIWRVFYSIEEFQSEILKIFGKCEPLPSNAETLFRDFSGRL